MAVVVGVGGGGGAHDWTCHMECVSGGGGGGSVLACCLGGGGGVTLIEPNRGSNL